MSLPSGVHSSQDSDVWVGSMSSTGSEARSRTSPTSRRPCSSHTVRRTTDAGIVRSPGGLLDSETRGFRCGDDGCGMVWAGEQDMDVPIPQSEEYFIALRKLGVSHTISLASGLHSSKSASLIV